MNPRTLKVKGQKQKRAQSSNEDLLQQVLEAMGRSEAQYQYPLYQVVRYPFLDKTRRHKWPLRCDALIFYLDATGTERGMVIEMDGGQHFGHAWSKCKKRLATRIENDMAKDRHVLQHLKWSMVRIKADYRNGSNGQLASLLKSAFERAKVSTEGIYELHPLEAYRALAPLLKRLEGCDGVDLTLVLPPVMVQARGLLKEERSGRADNAVAKGPASLPARHAGGSPGTKRDTVNQNISGDVDVGSALAGIIIVGVTLMVYVVVGARLLAKLLAALS